MGIRTEKEIISFNDRQLMEAYIFIKICIFHIEPFRPDKIAINLFIIYELAMSFSPLLDAPGSPFYCWLWEVKVKRRWRVIVGGIAN